MNNSVIVYNNSKRNINYKEILNFYDIEEYNNHSLLSSINKDDYQLVVIDTDRFASSIALANDIRNINPYTAIIFMVDSFYKGDVNKDLEKVNGLGKVEVVHYFEKEVHSLLRSVEGLLNPSLPQIREEVAIVIPVFNEVERIELVKKMLLKLKILLSKGMYNMGIYLIDDGSSDNTVEALEQYIEDIQEDEDVIYSRRPLSIHNLKVNTRKAGTYIEAFRSIDSDLIITLDADDSFDIEDMVKMINIIKRGYYDFVIATKDNSTESRQIHRRIISFCKRLLTKPFLPDGVTDSQTGLKVFKKDTINKLIPRMHIDYGLALDLEMLYLAKKLKYRVKELPVTIIDRDGSHVDLIHDTIKFIRSMFMIIKDNDLRRMV